MPTMVLRQPEHVKALVGRLTGRKLPITVSWAQGATKSSRQNRMAFQWFMDISRQLGDQTVEDVRAECKLRFGVPILRAENEPFRIQYDRVLRPLAYEDKLSAIKAWDLPITRLMTVKQMTVFLDEIQRHYLPQGLRLTDPEAMKYEEEFS